MSREMMRPGSAPARPVNQCHSEQVDLLVREMFGSIVSLASSSSSGLTKLQRPHTACAGARAVATVIVEASDDIDDDDSDGASLDPDDEEDAFEESSRRLPRFKAPYPHASGYQGGASSSGSKATDFDGSHRPAPALRVTFEGTESSRDTANVARSVNYLSTLPKGEQLLLSGLSSRLSEASERAQAASMKRAAAERSCPSTPSRPASATALPASMADKLPQSRVLQPPQQVPASSTPRQRRVAGGLAPRAAKYTSHNSWANHLPIRKPISITSALEKPQAPKEVAPSQETRQAPAVPPPAAPAVDPSSEAEPSSPGSKKRGPKYRVLPGGSRPALASLAAGGGKTNQRELVVLEFRTEPRVVPASRRRFVRGEESAAIMEISEVSMVSKKKIQSSLLTNKKSVGFAPHPRFRREDSGQWALEREALAKAK
eukprot:TRINITY_DN106170_c0_g1_i1.p1 TRINITY_DN106170_c0_g1~~TRINITY_DN106170_c0_g1_i1.p1  ORF type:complete len:431 (+),score=72.42 TRINITY_DN106170_c0_g1_i1:92-1384(+)